MKAKDKTFTAKEFRAELLKAMPGFNWTVQRAGKAAVRFFATGIQSSGFNRLATLRVERSMVGDRPWYTVKIAGHGTRAVFAGADCGCTLPRALRALQDQCQAKASTYMALVSKLENGRKPKHQN